MVQAKKVDKKRLDDLMAVYYWIDQLTGDLEADYPVAVVFKHLSQACSVIGVDLDEYQGDLPSIKEEFYEEVLDLGGSIDSSWR